MMNVPPSEAKALSLYDYQALLHNWQIANESEDDTPPDEDAVAGMFERMRASGMVH